ncbi:hypothetical protein L1887_38071 [Cichorium endivia]|nr:hypothetical protein L1887_38071 [Cichorium endivia]
MVLRFQIPFSPPPTRIHIYSELCLVTSEFKIGLLSIGLILCCLTIAGLVFYIVKKRRNSIYKKGFNPLPSSGR